MKKLVVFALVAVLSLGVFTACTRPDTGEEPTTKETTTVSTTTKPTTAATTTVPTTMAPTAPSDTLDSTGPSQQPKMPKLPRMR